MTHFRLIVLIIAVVLIVGYAAVLVALRIQENKHSEETPKK